MNKIDNRIVELSFDNKSFEKGITDSSKSLADFDKALKDSGNGSGISGLNSIIDNIHVKFSAFGTMAVGALMKIGSQAIIMGQQLFNSFAIQPVTAGFNEYELKINSIKTMLASGKTAEGLPVTLEQVNKELEVLNQYADQTIYSFSDMTSNIGKFTNAGVDLETSVQAIKGIANAAALSGASSAEASRAMYNFSQALSSGYVKLIDWKSIENANMATVEFKTQLLESAVAAGTLEKQADGMYKVLSSGKLINATNGFNDSLQDQWMTTEALTKTLNDYADETTEIGKKATEAATKVRTWSQLIDTTKEALQSGWAVSFENIFGDYDEATIIFTGLSNVIGDFIQNTSDARNGILKLWKDMGGRQYIIDGITTAWKNLTKVLGPIKDVFDDLIPSQVGISAKLVELSRKFKDLMVSLTPTEKLLNSIKIVFKGLVDILGTGFKIIKSVFDGIVKGIKNVIPNISLGDKILDFFNNFGLFLSGLKKYSENANIFEKISSSIANAFYFISNKIKIVKDFIKESTLISDIFNSVKKIFSDFNIDTTLITKFIDVLIALKNTLFGAFRNINIFGSNIENGVAKPLKVLGKSLAPTDVFIHKLREFIRELGEKLDPFIKILKKAFGVLGEFFAKTWETEGLEGILAIIRTIVGANVGMSLKDFIKSITGVVNNTGEFTKGIIGSLDSIRDVLVSYQANLNSKKLLTLAISVGILALALAVITTLDQDKLVKSGAALFGLLASMTSAMFLVSKMKGSATKASLTMVFLSAAVYILAKALKEIQGVDPAAVFWLGVIIGEVVIALSLLDKEKKKISGSAGTLLAMSLAIGIISKVVKFMGDLDPDVVKNGLIRVGLIALGLTAAVSIISLAGKDGSGMLQGAATILAAAFAVTQLAAVVALLGLMDPDKVSLGLGAIIGLLMSLSIAIAIIANSTSGANIWQGIAALLALVIAINMIVPTIIALSFIPYDKLAIGLGALAATIVILLVGLYGLGVVAGNLAPVIPFILALAASVLLFGAATWLVGKGVLALAMGLGLLGTVGSAGILILAAAIGAVIPAILGGLAEGLIEFSKIIKKGAPKIAESIVTVLTNIVTLLTKEYPKFIDAIFTFIDYLAGKLLEKIPEYTEIGMKIILGFLEGIATNIPEIFGIFWQMITDILNLFAEKLPELIESGANIIIAFIEGLTTEIPRVVETGTTLIIDFINGLADSIRTNTPLLLTAITNLCTAFLDGILVFFGIGDGTSSEGKGLSLQIIKGLVDGLGEGIESVVTAVKTVAQDLYDNFCSFFGIGEEGGSSSKFKEIASQIIQGLADGLTNGVSTVLSAVTTVGQNLITGFKDLFHIKSPSKVMEDIGINIIDGLDEGLESSDLDVIKATEGIMEKMILVINQSIPKFKEQGMLISIGIAEGVQENIGFTLNAFQLALDLIINKINSFLPIIKTKGFEIIDQIILGISNTVKMAQLGDTILEIMAFIVELIELQFAAIILIGQAFIENFITGLRDSKKRQQIANAAGLIMRNALTAMGDQRYKNMAVTVGQGIGDGVIRGINNRAANIVQAGTQLALRLIRAVMDYLGVSSPSKVFAEIGEYIDLGLVDGINGYSNLVVKSAEQLGQDSINGLKSVMNQISDAVSMEINTDPIIRPVLDLTGVKSGANDLNSIMAGRSYSLAASKLIRDRSMIADRQNGSNLSDENRRTIKNEFNLYGITIRSEADIDKIAEQLYRKQESAMRLRGMRPSYT